LPSVCKTIHITKEVVLGATEVVVLASVAQTEPLKMREVIESIS
jgi:hypothetical protein